MYLTFRFALQKWLTMNLTAIQIVIFRMRIILIPSSARYLKHYLMLNLNMYLKYGPWTKYGKPNNPNILVKVHALVKAHRQLSWNVSFICMKIFFINNILVKAHHGPLNWNLPKVTGVGFNQNVIYKGHLHTIKIDISLKFSVGLYQSMDFN